jgi:hypothetical protein
MGVPELFFSLPTREVMQAIWAVKYTHHEKHRRTVGANTGARRHSRRQKLPTKPSDLSICD